MKKRGKELRKAAAAAAAAVLIAGSMPSAVKAEEPNTDPAVDQTLNTVQETENPDTENLLVEEGTDTEESTGETDESEENRQPDEFPGGSEYPVPSGDYYMQDPGTGIIVEAGSGVIMPWVVAVVTPIESGEAFDALNSLYSLLLEQFRIYDISLYDALAQQLVQPGGSVKVSIPIPEGYDMSRLAVYSISTEGETPQRTALDFTVENGMAVFQTEHFSLYAVAETKEQLPEYLPETEAVEPLELVQTQQSSLAAGTLYGVSPKTGDGEETRGTAVCALLSAAVLLSFAGLKKKNEKKKKI